jgi:hypothetical protein
VDVLAVPADEEDTLEALVWEDEAEEEEQLEL